MIPFLLLSNALFAQISVTERLFSLGTSFEVSENHSEIGSIEKRLLSVAEVFDLKNQENQILATLTIRLVTPVIFWGDIGDITDAAGKKIATIEQDLLEIPPWREYRLIDIDETLLATARVDIWNLSIKLTHPEDPDKIYAFFKLPYFHHFRKQWDLEIEEDKIDRRLLYFLPIFHSNLHQ